MHEEAKEESTQDGTKKVENQLKAGLARSGEF